MHNNRAYRQEYMYLTAMAARHGRGVDRRDIGMTLKEPNIDYATVARGLGAHGEGPITDPKDLAPAVLAQTALPFEGFRTQIRNPVNDMPAYSDAVLSDSDIADIYVFVKSLPGPRSPRDIPILNN